MKREKLVVELEEQLLQPPFPGTFNEYNTKAIQYGYVAMFAAAYPLCGLVAAIANFVELRAFRISICTFRISISTFRISISTLSSCGPTRSRSALLMLLSCECYYLASTNLTSINLTDTDTSLTNPNLEADAFKISFLILT